MTITARFPSTCANCGGRIEAGDSIEYTKGHPVAHTSCPASPVLPDPPEELPVPQEHTRAGRMLVAGELDATITMANGQHCTVYARALRRTSEGWEKVGLLDAGAKVRLAAAKRGQRIGWIGAGFAVEWDGGVADETKQAVRALFTALGNAANIDREVQPIAVSGVPGQAVHIANEDEAGLYAPAGADWVRVQVANRCGRCGLELTQPVSIDRGVGPECYGKMTKGQHVEVIDPAPVEPAQVEAPRPAVERAWGDALLAAAASINSSRALSEAQKIAMVRQLKASWPAKLHSRSVAA